MFSDLAPSPVQPQFTPQKQLWQGGSRVNLTCWDRDQLERSQRVLKDKMQCSGDELSKPFFSPLMEFSLGDYIKLGCGNESWPLPSFP